MNSRKLVFSLASALLITGVFEGCRGPAGPPGPPGAPGDPVSAFEGFAPGIRCATCHDPEQDTTFYMAGRRYQWLQSKHAIGGDLEMNSATCAGCHTTEGFLQRMRGRPVTNQLHPSPPGCFTCHSPHARADFSIRTLEPVILRSNIATVADGVFDYGKGNICAQCHQPRTLSPRPNPNHTSPTDTLVIRTPRWHSHYGAQAQMLKGYGGFEFQGYSYATSYHSISSILREEGCISCHMAEQIFPPNAGTGKAGGHTMNIRYEWAGTSAVLLTGCNRSDCHGGAITPAVLENMQQPVVDSLQILEDLLIARGWLDPATKLVNASAANPLRITPGAKGGAIYNYFFVKYDQSRGIHNTRYALDLLRSSIQELQ